MTALFGGGQPEPVKIPKTPERQTATNEQDAASIEALNIKKRQGYQSTMSAANLTGGLLSAETVKKATLGV